jgi:hypothetical protein
MQTTNVSLADFQRFCGPDLSETLARIESSLQGMSAEELIGLLASINATDKTFATAGQLKQLLGQLNVVIHALGILLCLPKILEPGERIESVSLGAGNTGRKFDLETDRRVAEFKFTRWQGGSETIRQNNFFVDFYLLAESTTPRMRCLYLLGTDYALKFMRGRRALASVFDKHMNLYQQFRAKYGDQYQVVRDYYVPRQSTVSIVDMTSWLGSPSLEDEATA